MAPGGQRGEDVAKRMLLKKKPKQSKARREKESRRRRREVQSESRWKNRRTSS